MYQVLFKIPLPAGLDWLPDWMHQGIPIYGYGMMLFVAFILCTWLAGRRGEKEGISKEVIQDLALWLFVGGLLGSRVVYLLDAPPEGADPSWPWSWQFLTYLPRIWDGGVVFYGGAIGGLVGYLLAYVFKLRKLGIPTLKMADIAAPSIAVGLFLGRIGCLLNGCCYGQAACPECQGLRFPLSAPVRYALVQKGVQTAAGFTVNTYDPDPGDAPPFVDAVDPDSAAYRDGLREGDRIVKFDQADIRSYSKLEEYLTDTEKWKGKATVKLTVVKPDGTEKELAFTPWTVPVLPTQLYESISMLLVFLLLTAYYPLRRHQGEVMALLMMCYGVHRLLNEQLRIDKRPGSFEIWISVLLVVASLALFVWLRRQPAGARVS